MTYKRAEMNTTTVGKQTDQYSTAADSSTNLPSGRSKRRSRIDADNRRLRGSNSSGSHLEESDEKDRRAQPVAIKSEDAPRVDLLLSSSLSCLCA